MTLDCGGVVGRYVTVMHPDVPPLLCEVEVYSTWVFPQNIVPQRPPSHGKWLHSFEILQDRIIAFADDTVLYMVI